MLFVYLDSSIATDKDDWNIKGYKLRRADHPNIFNRGGLCICVKESLPVRCLSNMYLQECFNLEVSINNKKGFVVSLYGSLVKLLVDLTPLLLLSIYRNYWYL